MRRSDPPSATVVFDVTPWWLNSANVDHPDREVHLSRALSYVVEIVRQHLRTYPIHSISVGEERVEVSVPIQRPQQLVYLQEQLYQAREALDELLPMCEHCRGKGFIVMELRKSRKVQAICRTCDGQSWMLTASAASSSIAGHAQATADTNAGSASGTGQHPDRRSSKERSAARAAANRTRSAPGRAGDRSGQGKATKARNGRTPRKA